MTTQTRMIRAEVEYLKAQMEAEKNIHQQALKDRLNQSFADSLQIHDMESRCEYLEQTTQQIKDCNLEFDTDGISAYDSLAQDLQDTSAEYVNAYKDIAENEPIRGEDLDKDPSMLEAPKEEDVQISTQERVLVESSHGHVEVDKDYKHYLDQLPDDIKKMQLDSMMTVEEKDAFEEALSEAQEWGLSDEGAKAFNNDFARTNEMLDSNEGHPQAVRKDLINNVKQNTEKLKEGWEKCLSDAYEKNPKLTSKEVENLRNKFIKENKKSWSQTKSKSSAILQKGMHLDRTVFGKDEKAAFDAFKNAQKNNGKNGIGGTAIKGLQGMAQGINADDPVQGTMQVMGALASTAYGVFDFLQMKKKAVDEAQKTLNNSDLTKTEIKTKTIEQAKPVPAEELAEAQKAMEKQLQNLEKNAKDKTKINTIENKMPNGDTYKFEFKPQVKSNGMPGTQGKLKMNGKTIAKGNAKQLSTAYAKQMQKVAQKTAKEVAKTTKKVAEKAAKASAKAAAKAAANSNPYTAIASAVKEVLEKGKNMMQNKQMQER